MAKRYVVNPKTIAKCKARTSVSGLPTGPKEPRSTVLSVEEEAVVVAHPSNQLDMNAPAKSRTKHIAVLREQETGLSTAEVCRKHGISTATFYGWKAKFGGMEVSEAKRLKQLEDENAKLKRLLADAMPDNAALNDPAALITPQICGVVSGDFLRYP